ncbi:MAG: hypothetical protein O2798_07020 [Chloroflexi bacterium]|nr:hypothetical protein [Chloroflexota bacterium]MDA1240578.1 hypothetical protein [Chloroflexota bacterium]
MADESSEGTPAIDALLADLGAARDALIAAVAGVTAEAFVQPVTEGDDSVRDVLWQAGLVEDWTRRAVGQATGGRAVDAFQPIRRPDRLTSVELLLEWLSQTRRPLVSLLRRTAAEALEVECRLPDGEAVTPRALLERLVAREQAAARQILAIRSMVEPKR